MTAKPTQFDISSTFSQLVTDFNTVSLDLGGTGRLTTNQDSDAVSAINELEVAIRGTSNNLAASDITTTAKNLVGSVNELDAELGTITAGAMGTTASTVSAAVLELHGEVTTATTNIATINTKLGTVSAGNMGTSASTVVTAIAELEAEIDTLNTKVSPATSLTTTATTTVGGINELDAEIGAASLATSATTVKGAINELHGEIGTAISGNHLTAGNIGASLNSLATKIGSVTAGNMGTTASTVVTAIAELEAEIDVINSQGAGPSNTAIGTLTDLTTSTQANLVAAVNEIEAVFDASTHEISAGTNAFDVVSGAFTIDASGTISLDAATTALTGNLDMSTDTGRLRLGAGNDLSIFHDGSNSYIQDNGTGDLILRGSSNIKLQSAGGTTHANFNSSGAVTLNHAGNEKFISKSTGAGITGQLDLSSHLDMPDNAIIKLGTGDDLQIYHDASNSYIKDAGTGGLYLRTNLLSIQSDDGLETYATFTDNGAVDLYHNASKRFETTATGIDVTGELTLDTDAVIKGGSSAAITFAGANVTMGGTITPSVSLTTSASTVAAAINELKASIPIVYNAAGSALN
jgi:hypothetical protein